MNLISLVSDLLSLLTFITGLALLIFVAIFTYKKIAKNNLLFFNKILIFVKKNALLLSLIVALTATLGSLFYSEIAGYAPCKLCWYQRIFMYPQVVLLGIAIWKKDIKIVNYVIPLSIIGALIASYHYYLQLGFKEDVACAVVGYSALCSDRFFLHYGYITIPMQALTAFLLIVALSYTLKRIDKG
jgi:hypothetical protein